MNIINKVQGQDKNIPLLTVLFSGRTMLIGDILNKSNAFLDAFLPGTSGGQGVVNAITGTYVIRPNGSQDRKNSLAFDWPSTSVQIYDYVGLAKQFSSVQGRREDSKDRKSTVHVGLWTKHEMIIR